MIKIIWLLKFRIICLHKRVYYKFMPGFISRRLKSLGFKKEKKCRTFLLPKQLPKKIWMYWAQGWRNAPLMIKRCRDSWIENNPNWEIIFLTDNNLLQYTDIQNLFFDKNMSKNHRADLLRLNLLKKYGGVWVDATTYCERPLDHWLLNLMQSGFFAFQSPEPDRKVSSWFLASIPENKLVSKWLDLSMVYWKNTFRADHYFWLHYMFEEVLKKSFICKKIWRLTPKLSSDGPHIVQKFFRGRRIDVNYLNYLLVEKIIPVYKFSRKVPFSKTVELGTALEKLVRKVNG